MPGGWVGRCGWGRCVGVGWWLLGLGWTVDAVAARDARRRAACSMAHGGCSAKPAHAPSALPVSAATCSISADLPLPGGPSSRMGVPRHRPVAGERGIRERMACSKAKGMAQPAMPSPSVHCTYRPYMRAHLGPTPPGCGRRRGCGPGAGPRRRSCLPAAAAAAARGRRPAHTPPRAPCRRRYCSAVRCRRRYHCCRRRRCSACACDCRRCRGSWRGLRGMARHQHPWPSPAHPPSLAPPAGCCCCCRDCCCIGQPAQRHTWPARSATAAGTAAPHPRPPAAPPAAARGRAWGVWGAYAPTRPAAAGPDASSSSAALPLCLPRTCARLESCSPNVSAAHCAAHHRTSASRCRSSTGSAAATGHRSWGSSCRPRRVLRASCPVGRLLASPPGASRYWKGAGACWKYRNTGLSLQGGGGGGGGGGQQPASCQRHEECLAQALACRSRRAGSCGRQGSEAQRTPACAAPAPGLSAAPLPAPGTAPCRAPGWRCWPRRPPPPCQPRP